MKSVTEYNVNQQFVCKKNTLQALPSQMTKTIQLSFKMKTNK